METALAHLSIECSEWNPETLLVEELELFWPTTLQAHFQPSTIEPLASEKLRRYLLERHTLPYILVLYAIDQECAHISSKVKSLRVNKKGAIAPFVSNMNGQWRHRFWKAYGRKAASRFRYHDWRLWKLAARGPQSDHLDTVEFFIQNFGAYR